MALTEIQKKKVLAVLLAVLAIFIVYRVLTAEEQKRVPLTYKRGAVAASAVRTGHASPGGDVDLLQIFLKKKEEKFPGVKRNIFLMADPKPRPKKRPTMPKTPPPPPVPVKTAEEIAADFARADLSKFRFLGFLTEEDSTLFLSKDGELYTVKSGDRILKNYSVKEAGKNYVILLDTATKVEVRIELTGGESQPQRTQQPQRQRQPPSYRPAPVPYQGMPPPYQQRQR